MATDENEGVRAAAAEALKKIRPPGASALTAPFAKEALLRYMDLHPEAFVSPGRAESAAELRKERALPVTSEVVMIGRFQVDLDARTYLLVHHYGKPGGGWFENWEWRGKFELNEQGGWEITEPKETKAWGE